MNFHTAHELGTLRRKIGPRLRELRFFLYTLRRSTLAIVGVAIIVVFVFISIFGDYVAPYDPYELNVTETLMPPSLKHLFGTDEVGRDILSRVLVGAKYSLQISIVTVVIAVAIGAFLGSVAGWYGGRLEELLMRLTDFVLAFPIFIFAMAVAAALGPSLQNVMFALSVSWWPYYARLIRSQVLTVRESQYVMAAKVMGAGKFFTLFRHIIPNSLSPILIAATLDIGWVITYAAGLSFIGFGAQPPLPEWGLMISNSRSYIQSAWWYPAFPGIIMVLVVIGFNFLGDGLRDAADPKIRRLLEVKGK